MLNEVRSVNKLVSQIIYDNPDDPLNCLRAGSHSLKKFETDNLYAISFIELFVVGKSGTTIKVWQRDIA